mmetsp:Transcript_18597/g.42983  ORF Transcript_18597/g.42983 Transcript_18597/m.42983 type:complete len:299 (+) Transcript_18597:1305-2201(+)
MITSTLSSIMFIWFSNSSAAVIPWKASSLQSSSSGKNMDRAERMDSLVICVAVSTTVFMKVGVSPSSKLSNEMMLSSARLAPQIDTFSSFSPSSLFPSPDSGVSTFSSGRSVEAFSGSFEAAAGSSAIGSIFSVSFFGSEGSALVVVVFSSIAFAAVSFSFGKNDSVTVVENPDSTPFWVSSVVADTACAIVGPRFRAAEVSTDCFVFSSGGSSFVAAFGTGGSAPRRPSLSSTSSIPTNCFRTRNLLASTSSKSLVISSSFFFSFRRFRLCRFFLDFFSRFEEFFLPDSRFCSSCWW